MSIEAGNDMGPLFERVKLHGDQAPADTLSEARADYIAILPAGTTCPCCDRYGKSYRRKLNSGMALALTWLVCRATAMRAGASQIPWVDVPAHAPRAVLSKARDFTVLRYWGLIDRQKIRVKNRERTKHPGLWRPTPKGVAFVQGTAGVPSHAVVYNDHVSRLDGPLITIRDALGDRFHYGELIAEWGGVIT